MHYNVTKLHNKFNLKSVKKIFQKFGIIIIVAAQRQYLQLQSVESSCSEKVWAVLGKSLAPSRDNLVYI